MRVKKKRLSTLEERKWKNTEVEAMARNADTAMGRDMTRTRAGNYIKTRHHSDTKISQRKMKLQEPMSRSFWHMWDLMKPRVLGKLACSPKIWSS